MPRTGAKRNVGDLRRNSKGKRDDTAHSYFARVRKRGNPQPAFAVELDVVRTKPQVDAPIRNQTAVVAHFINFDGVAERGGIEKKPFRAFRIGGQPISVFDHR